MRRPAVLAVLLAAVLAVPGPAAVAHEKMPVGTPARTELSEGFDLVAAVNPGAGTNADVYAYRDHAYLASWVGKGCLSSGVRTYDLGNPRAPRLVSTFADRASDPSVAGTWTEKVIVQRVRTRHFDGDLAVVSFQACDRADPTAPRGFGLYDVTNPARPRKLAFYSAPDTRGSHEIWLGASGGRAYVYTAIIDSELTSSPDYDPATRTATTPGQPDFRIVDVANPGRPVAVGGWGAWRELGIAPFAGRRSNFVHSVRVDARLRTAYLSYWDLGTVLLDVRNPHRPRYLGRTTPDQDHTHSSYVTDRGRTLVETHETAGGLPHYYDISDPARPRLLSRFTTVDAETDTVHDPKVRGEVTYFSWYSLGVLAVDSRDPSAPRRVAQFVPDTDYLNPDFYCEVRCSQVWGVALAGRYVLASDMNSGLYVLRRR
jgi:hypothetical protein